MERMKAMAERKELIIMTILKHALAAGTFERRCCRYVQREVRVAIAQPKLAEERDFSPRAI